MAPKRILILGHSFIHRLESFLIGNFNATIAKTLTISGDLLFKWHGIGGRTVEKTPQHDLDIVRSFAPNVVVIQLGTNDLRSVCRSNWLGN